MNAGRIFTVFFTSSASHAGLTYLTQNAKLFYDFTTLSGDDGGAITSVTDLSPNGINASNESPAQSPVLLYSQWGKDRIRTFKAHANSSNSQENVLIANTYGEGLFKTDFEVIWLGAQSNESDRDFFGVATSTNIVRCNITSNKVRFEYRYSAATARRFVADSPSTFFTASENSGLSLFRIKCDFTNDVFKFWYNGVEISMTSLVDAFNLIDPTKWANSTNKLCIGGYNNGGTITLYANYHLMANFAVTPILTDQEAIDVSDYLSNGMTAI